MCPLSGFGGVSTTAERAAGVVRIVADGTFGPDSPGGGAYRLDERGGRTLRLVLLLVGVLVLAVVVGLVFGGSLTNLAELSFRWWPLALIGLALQFVPAGSHMWAVALLILSYVVLTAFVAVNLRLPGMWLIALGFVLNIVVIGANAGMPVADGALRTAYGRGYAEQRRELASGAGGAKHHLQRPSDRLIALADVIPVGAPVRIVTSAGDLLSLAGAGWLVAAATLGRVRERERGGKHRRRRAVGRQRGAGVTPAPDGSRGADGSPTP